jgi:N-acyl-D-amino-acid deacylase
MHGCWNDAQTLARIRPEVIDNLARRGGADRIQFRSFAPDTTVEGDRLSDVANAWGLEPFEAALRMARLGPAGIVSFNMDEHDVATLMARPWTMTSSDGSLPRWGAGVPHPRAFGAFPQKIRVYALDNEVVEPPDVIRSMTSLPAQVFGLNDRGILREGAIADLVLFDPARIRDRATFTEPYQLAEGVVYVFVNGETAWAEESATGVLAGRVLRKAP